MSTTVPLFVDGEFVPETGEWITRQNPSRPNEEAGRVPEASVELANKAVESAHEAFEVWSRTPAVERCRMIAEAVRAAEAMVESVAQLMCRETGKPINDCRGEIRFAGTYARGVIPVALDLCEEDREDSPSGIVIIRPQPFGVVAALTPWNAPIILSLLKVVPALATGNTVVVKPSPLAPLAVTAYLGAMAARLPDGCLNVVAGGAEVGSAIIGHPLTRKVAFTGGGEVGRRVATIAAAGVKPLVLELGGNDPAILLEDVVFDDPAIERLVFGAFLTAGQVCMAAKQIWVPADRHDELVERFTEVANRVLVMGDAENEETTIGPVGTEESKTRLTALIADAAAAGATVTPVGRTGGADDGWFVQPTLVTGLEVDHPLVRDEQFGPVVPIVAYTNLDEVIEHVNASPLGLASSVWSTDTQAAVDVARELRVGYTFINSHNRAGMSLHAPFGGVRESGYGREYGSWGVAEYLQTHTIHVPVAVQGGAYPE